MTRLGERYVAIVDISAALTGGVRWTTLRHSLWRDYAGRRAMVHERAHTDPGGV